MTAVTGPCPATITALILAGGAASRMGGLDKGLADLAGAPLVEHVAARLSPQVSGVLVSANRHLPQWRRYGWRVLGDAPPLGRGPLAGILTGLEACPTEWLLVVPCDAPALPTDLALRLAAADATSPLRIAHAGGNWQPVFALLHRGLAADLRAFLAAAVEASPAGHDPVSHALPAGESDESGESGAAHENAGPDVGLMRNAAADSPRGTAKAQRLGRSAPSIQDAPAGAPPDGLDGLRHPGWQDTPAGAPREGGRKVMAWMARHEPIPVHWADAGAFINLNTPAELHAFAQRLAPVARPGPPLWVGRAPVLGIAAPSGTGKTTLLEATLPHLVAAELRVALVKHAHHDFDIDQPGKDSHRLRQAGARQVVVGSTRRLASIIERADPDQPPTLGEFLARIDPSLTDLVLVEGFKRDPLPRLALTRTAAPSPPVPLDDPWLVALASDDPASAAGGLPCLDIDDPAAVAAFIIRWRRERLLACLPTEPT